MNRFKDWAYPFFNEDGLAYWRDNKGKKRYYGWRCQNSDGLVIEDKVDVGAFTYMNAKYGIEIEDNVQIGSHCSIYSINTENNTKGKIIVGENSMIGSHSLILPNTTIPPNSKIPAYSIVVGNKVYKTERKEYELL